jgi:8-amino-7-oxononanoate synthase
MEMESRLKECLDRREREGTLRSLMPLPTLSSSSPNLSSSASPIIDFSSNDYLGFARCPEQHRRVESAYEEFMSSTTSHSSGALLGATGSRLLSGDSNLARSLEANLAHIHNRPAALLFNSGYDANLSVLSSLPYRDDGKDVIIMDELVHNSLVMGVRMGRLKKENVYTFRHNNVDDLKRVLGNVINMSSVKTPTVLIVIESVYSMDGDIAPMKDILDVAEHNGAAVIVDEAHGLGIFGRTNVDDMTLEPSTDRTCHQDNDRAGGTGALAALNLEHHPALLCSVHTFGKAAGCHGAVVAGSNIVISYLINYARPFVYSTALPPHSLVSIQQSYESMMSEEGEKRRKVVFHFVRVFRQAMNIGLSSFGRGCQFELLPSPSPIQAVLVPGNESCISICTELREVDRFDVYPIRSPTVPKGKERIRIILHAHNKEEEVRALVKALLLSFRRSMVFSDSMRSFTTSKL